MQLERDGDVHLITLEEADQKLNGDSLAALNNLLDQVEATAGSAALVLTGQGKTFHQGLDLPYVRELGEAFVPFIKQVHQLFGRLLSLDLPTVAAINGHAIAGGAMIATCFDHRVMRADRGWFRTPEVELNMPFSVIMNDLLTARLPQPAMHRLMVLGDRMSGAEAAAAGVVDEAVEGEESVLPAALKRASELAAFRGASLQAIRSSLYAPLLAEIAADAARDDLYAR